MQQLSLHLVGSGYPLCRHPHNPSSRNQTWKPEAPRLASDGVNLSIWLDWTIDLAEITVQAEVTVLQ